MSIPATTIGRYVVITSDGGNVRRYRDPRSLGFPQIVARRDSNGVLSSIEVAVSWAGHEGRSPIDGSYTIADLSENVDLVYGKLRAAIEFADTDALMGLIRAATYANTEALGNNDLEITDYEAVRTTVAAALGVAPHPGIPTTLKEAIEWRRNFVDEEFYVLASV